MKPEKDALKSARRAIAAIAFRECKTVAEVRSDMEKAIRYGISNPDPTVQALWKTIPCAGESPKPEELILWAMAKLSDSAN